MIVSHVTLILQDENTRTDSTTLSDKEDEETENKDNEEKEKEEMEEEKTEEFFTLEEVTATLEEIFPVIMNSQEAEQRRRLSLIVDSIPAQLLDSEPNSCLF